MQCACIKLQTVLFVVAFFPNVKRGQFNGNQCNNATNIKKVQNICDIKQRAAKSLDIKDPYYDFYWKTVLHTSSHVSNFKMGHFEREETSYKKEVSQQMLAQSEKTRSTIDLAAQSMAQNQAGVRRGENLKDRGSNHINIYSIFVMRIMGPGSQQKMIRCKKCSISRGNKG